MERFIVGDYVFAAILDAVPSPIFIVDNDVKIHAYNMAAAPFFSKEPEKIFRTKSGDALHCIHSSDSPEGCGRGDACKECVIRKSVLQSYQGDKFVREKCEMQLVRGKKTEQIQMLISTAPVSFLEETFVIVILEDVTEIEALRNILPICVNCKKIRDDKDYWENVESYLSKYLDVQFTHGICPECIKKLYPNLTILLPIIT